jgi:hypothetical protein
VLLVGPAAEDTMVIRLQSLLFALLWALALPVKADALVQSQALNASSIAQYYIDERGVTLELEIGLSSLQAFRNLMPDAVFRDMGFGDAPLAERLELFFTSDMAIVVEGATWLRSALPAGCCAIRLTARPCRCRSRRPR